MHDNRNTILISISRLISELGSVALRFALSLYILDITGSPLMSGFVFAFTYIPGILVNTFAGVLIDRSDKKKMLVATDLLSGVATLLFMLLFLFQPHSISLIIGYVCVLYLFQAVFVLALNASIPEIVSEGRVVKANSSVQSIGALVNILGIFLGAAIYLMLGLEMILLIDGVSFIISGFVNMFIVFAYKSKRKGEEKRPYAEDLKRVYRFIMNRKAVKNLLLVFVGINFIIAPVISVALLYIIREELQMLGYEMAFIEAALGVGFIIGALLVSVKKIEDLFKNKIFVLIQLAAVMIILWIFPTVFSFESKVVITIIYMIILAFTGIFHVMANIPMISYVQIKIPESIRASIFGVVNTITTLSAPVGMLIYGAALEVINWVYLVAGSGVILFLIGFAAQRNKDLREFFKDDSHLELEIDSGVDTSVESTLASGLESELHAKRKENAEY